MIFLKDKLFILDEIKTDNSKPISNLTASAKSKIFDNSHQKVEFQ